MSVSYSKHSRGIPGRGSERDEGHISHTAGRPKDPVGSERAQLNSGVRNRSITHFSFTESFPFTHGNCEFISLLQ